MLEGILKSSFIELMALWPIPDEPPSYKTKSMTKIHMNKCMAETYSRGRLRTREAAMLEGVVSRNTPPLKVIIY